MQQERLLHQVARPAQDRRCRPVLQLHQPLSHLLEWRSCHLPLTQQSDEAPRRHCTIANLYDTTDEVAVKYNGLCLLATEEPTTFAEAEQHKCWRQVMLEEIRPIEENST